MRGFWRHEEHETEQESFLALVDGLIIKALETIMADIAKLTADIDAQAPLIAALQSKVTAQAAKITELEAQIAAVPPADPQAPIDALAATVEANNAALTAAAG